MCFTLHNLRNQHWKLFTLLKAIVSFLLLFHGMVIHQRKSAARVVFSTSTNICQKMYSPSTEIASFPWPRKSIAILMLPSSLRWCTLRKASYKWRSSQASFVIVVLSVTIHICWVVASKLRYFPSCWIQSRSLCSRWVHAEAR